MILARLLTKRETSYVMNIHLALFYSQDEGPLKGMKSYSHTLVNKKNAERNYSDERTLCHGKMKFLTCLGKWNIIFIRRSLVAYYV